MSMALESELIEAYQAIHEAEGNPEWAIDVVPTIPFAGRRYAEDRFLLVYASAENLAGYHGRYERFPVESNPWNRSRQHFEDWQRLAPGKREFFPQIHIQPASD